MRRGVSAWLSIVMAAAAPGSAQTTLPPGPWVVDVRGVTSPVPNDAAYYPPFVTASVPSRGFGVDAGGHFYLFSLGPARIGLGASIVHLRGTAAAPASATGSEGDVAGQRVISSMRMLAPQISFNFGSRDGWSYLSAGLGAGRLNSETEGVLPGRHESGWLRAVNYGGGARWFITPRLAFGFDVRAHRLAAGADTPGASVLAIGAGLSLR